MRKYIEIFKITVARYARRNSPEEINAEGMNLIEKIIRLKN